VNVQLAFDKVGDTDKYSVSYSPKSLASIQDLSLQAARNNKDIIEILKKPFLMDSKSEVIALKKFDFIIKEVNIFIQKWQAL